MNITIALYDAHEAAVFYRSFKEEPAAQKWLEEVQGKWLKGAPPAHQIQVVPADNYGDKPGYKVQIQNASLEDLLDLCRIDGIIRREPGDEIDFCILYDDRF